MNYQSNRNDMTDHFRFRIWMNLSLLGHITILGVCEDTECQCIVAVDVCVEILNASTLSY